MTQKNHLQKSCRSINGPYIYHRKFIHFGNLHLELRRTRRGEDRRIFFRLRHSSRVRLRLKTGKEGCGLKLRSMMVTTAWWFGTSCYIYIYIFIGTYNYIYIGTYIYIYIQVHTFIYIYIQVHTFIYIYIYADILGISDHPN